MKAKGLGVTCLALLLSGCTAALNVHPSLPPPSGAPVSSSKVGIYFSPGSVANEYREKHGSGIWPSTEYRFSPAKLIQEDLTTLTKRHYNRCGYAESAVDRQWDRVVEYFCYPPGFEPKTLQAETALQFTMRDPVTGHTLDSMRLVGRSEKQPGRWLRIIAGRLAEKPALEKTLSQAYTDLFRKVDATLAGTVAKESYSTRTRPYQRRGTAYHGRNPMEDGNR